MRSMVWLSRVELSLSVIGFKPLYQFMSEKSGWLPSQAASEAGRSASAGNQAEP